MSDDYDNRISFAPIPPNTNWRELLRDTNPHDVEIRITYLDGTTRKFPITWECIEDLAKYHNRCAVAEVYELGLYR